MVRAVRLHRGLPLGMLWVLLLDPSGAVAQVAPEAPPEPVQQTPPSPVQTPPAPEAAQGPGLAAPTPLPAPDSTNAQSAPAQDPAPAQVGPVPPPPSAYGPQAAYPPSAYGPQGAYPPSPAQPGPASVAGPAEGRHEHDGFLLRLALGFGFIRGSESDGGRSLTLSGVGGVTSIAIGGGVAPNLIINGEIFGGSVTRPSLTLDGADLGDLEADFTVSGLGVGITYYIMPINIYLAASAGVGGAQLTNERADLDTGTGLAASFMAGKEWWVGDNWGMGVATQVMLMSLPDTSDARLTVFTFGLLFSATYN